MWLYDNRKWMVPAIYVCPRPTLGILDFQLEIITFSWGSGRRKCCLWDLSCLLQSKKENILYTANIKFLNCAVIMLCEQERFYLTLLSTLIGFLNEPHYSLSPLFSCTVASLANTFAVFWLLDRLLSWCIAIVWQSSGCAWSAGRVAGESCTWHFSLIRYLILAQ